jgi:hypothetical protein
MTDVASVITVVLIGAALNGIANAISARSLKPVTSGRMTTDALFVYHLVSGTT